MPSSAPSFRPLASASNGSLDEIARYLTDGYWDAQGAGSASFGNTITVDIGGLTADGQKLARWAFEAWEAVADITFVETSGKAQIVFDDDQPGAMGGITSYYPSNGEAIAGMVNISTDWLEVYGTGIDGYAFSTYMHELGHALGLGHPGLYDASATYGTDEIFANDSWQITIMSYFDQEQNTSVDATKAATLTPMMADILAIQSLYGAPGKGSATSGDTVWGAGTTLDGYLGAFFDTFAGEKASRGLLTEGVEVALTLYDRDGHDRISLGFSETDDRISLEDGTFSDIGGAIGNLGIARGTIIEDLVTGSGDDTVTGNDADNMISTRAGDDEVSGGEGRDAIYGGAGNDLLRGGAGNDTLGGGTGDDTLEGDGGRDALWGGTGHDVLRGGAGNDTLGGFDGDDVLDGGSGEDELWGAKGDDTIWGGSGDDTLGGFDGDDVLHGQEGHDEIWGASGNDYLHGGAGDDQLGGGTENDTLDGGTGNDVVSGGLGHDLIAGGAGQDTLYGAAGDDTLRGGAGDDVIFGGSGADTFVYADGDEGRDRINGFSLGQGDRLSLDADLWSGTLDADGVIDAFASRQGDDIVFDFGDVSFVLLDVESLSGFEAAIDIA
ncbi:M10 family metallopeptidase [Palleronia sp. LCG004]|uniref:M10 family metallopeptidase n=1 Tax=Palleronia sp. LCG004 TaxID=3079304 RepID=UPI0029429331|nr:M10 family metallopeptidase [Palleronia sp. LCG004]WOI58430.1 M10 family metallopeptidase [Palleronia sp. LCG004]